MKHPRMHYKDTKSEFPELARENLEDLERQRRMVG